LSISFARRSPFQLMLELLDPRPTNESAQFESEFAVRGVSFIYSKPSPASRVRGERTYGLV
jgi:hypothetical protein